MPSFWNGRHGFALALASIVALLAAPCVFAQGGEPQYFAIRGAKVVTVSGPPIENGTVVVARGLIAAVGKDVTIPAEAWVIDGKGLIVYPGLIDAFTDVGIPPAAPAKAGEGGAAKVVFAHGPEDRPGTTTWRNAADEVSLSDKRIETWRAAGFTTVISAPKGGAFPGLAAVLDLAGTRASDLVVKSPVAIPATLEITGGDDNFPSSLMGALAYAHQLWLDIEWSAKAEAAYQKKPVGRERPNYDRSVTALRGALDQHAVVLIAANETVQLRRALQLADLWKVRGVIYGGQMAYEVSDEIAAKKMPVLVNLKWPEADKDADPEDKPTLRTLRFRDRAPGTPAALAKAGAKFAFYSDGVAAPKDILKAVKKSIDAGLTPEAAVRALTLSAAEIYGVADRMGSIENGKIANLVVTDGDLFQEKTKIKMVFVDGRKFEVREPVRPSEEPKGDMSGKWKLSYKTPEGPEEGAADISMDSDGELSGTFSSKRGSATIFSGYHSGEKFHFTINLPIESTPTDVTFSGTLDEDSIKGSIRVLDLSIDFTGTRPKTDASPKEKGIAQ